MALKLNSLFDRIKPSASSADAPGSAFGAAPNKKGEGFRFVQQDGAVKKKRSWLNLSVRQRRMLVGAFGLSLLTSGTVVLVEQHASLDFVVMILAFSLLCGLVVYDVAGRRLWESTITAQMRGLISNHDRLVREVARNRNDMAVLKEGLSETATALDKQSRKFPAALHSAEARMIETIAEQLAAMGQPRRGDLNTGHDNEILELEMAPPPPRKAPMSALERELNANVDSLSDTVVTELVRHAVHNGRADVFVQPVVTLPHRKPAMHELCVRIRARAGVYVPAARAIKLAHEETLVPALDHLVLLRALKNVRESKDGRTFVINISGASLHDSGFINDLLTFVAKNRAMAKRLVFEMRQAEFEALNKKYIGLLEGLSMLGCRFSMDNVRKRLVDVAALRKFKVSYLKIDAGWLLREAAQRGGVTRIHRLKKQLAQAGIELIADRVESETEVRELLDIGIDFAQGYAFAKPALQTEWNAKPARRAPADTQAA